MIFWVAAGIMALAVGVTLILGLRRKEPVAQEAADFDRRVYRDQLREVERDGARGIIAPEEAQRLRAEVARRLIDADRVAAQSESTALPSGPAGPVVALVLLVIVGAAFGGYVWLGQPGYPDLPLQARVAMAEDRRAERPAQAEMEADLPPQPPLSPIDPEFVKLVEQLRLAVANRPDDLQGQQLLARNEANLGNFAAAHQAQSRVISLKGPSATEEDLLLQATLMIQATGGRVSPEAEQALIRVLDRNPRSDTALFFSGVANMQVGRHDLTFRQWRQLLETASEDSPWLEEVRARIEGLAEVAGVRYELPPDARALPGPNAAAMAAAADMTPEERQTMIRGMVEGLNDRLATQGGSAQEWARLIVALGQLGETDRARAIWTEAQKNFAGRDAELTVLRQAAETAGVAG